MVKRLIKKIAGIGRKPDETTRASTSEHAPDSGPRPPGKEEHGESERKNESTQKHWSIKDFKVPRKKGHVRFHDLGLPPQLMHAIHDLGFEYCTPIQGKVLLHTEAGQNVAGRAQTGTGKTAAFLIRIFSQFIANRPEGKRRPGTPRALVIAPTRELVMQIENDARQLARHCHVSTMAVYGGMDFEKQQRRLQGRPIDLIAATPGRLLDFVRRRVLDLKQVEVLVIDEADRMLDMGFIPDVRRIVRATPPKDRRQTMLFSATLTDVVLRLASQWMPDPVICEVDPEQVTVDTVKQMTYAVTSREKFPLLYNILQRKDVERVLLFCNRRDSTKRLADNLSRHGIPCEYLSGAVRQEKRMKILEGFRSGTIRIVVATDVAGRGLHVDNITHVINYEFPYEPEDYVHRIGRTGRAGVEGTAISFACEYESFVIPQIEEYIGEPLPCSVPEEELLKPPPRPAPQRNRPTREGEVRDSRHRSGSGRRGQGRGHGRRPRGGGNRRGGHQGKRSQS